MQCSKKGTSVQFKRDGVLLDLASKIVVLGFLSRFFLSLYFMMKNRNPMDQRQRIKVVATETVAFGQRR